MGVQIERFFGSIKFAVSPVSLILDNELRLYVLYSFALSVRKKKTHTVVHHCFDFSDKYLRISFALVAEQPRAERHSRKPNSTAF